MHRDTPPASRSGALNLPSTLEAGFSRSGVLGLCKPPLFLPIAVMINQTISITKNRTYMRGFGCLAISSAVSFTRGGSKNWLDHVVKVSLNSSMPVSALIDLETDVYASLEDRKTHTSHYNAMCLVVVSDEVSKRVGSAKNLASSGG